MNKIMFNDKYGLTQAVLEGRKTMTRRICKYDRPNESYEIVFPVFEPKDYDDNGNIISPLNGAFGWNNKNGDFTGWNIPKYKVGEVVAIAQPYKDILDYLPEGYRRKSDGWISDFISTSSGLNNKMFVCPDLMPHHIHIANIGIECLQNISDEDCLKEGIREQFKNCGYGNSMQRRVFGYVEDKGIKQQPFDTDSSKEAFAMLIDRISGYGTWESNPFVFVYEFELID